ncbi:MAG: hypothetical protein ACNI3H_05635 [Halarcobacter ebronensis]
MKEHTFYSLRNAENDNLKGYTLSEFLEIFLKVYETFERDGYFNEAFGFYCIDSGYEKGYIADVELEILLKIRKRIFSYFRTLE